jgi:hypothetical protein
VGVCWRQGVGIDMKAGRKRDVARLLLIAVLATGLTTGAVSDVIGQAAEETAPSVPEMGSYLSQMTDLADSGEVTQARAMADRFASIYQSEVGDSPGKRAFVEGQLAYVRGEYAAAASGFEAAKLDAVLVEKSGGRFFRLLGGTYLRLGRIPEAIDHLQTALAIYRRVDKIGLSGPVRTRLGEAYRRAGRPAEARAELDEAKRIDSKGGKGLAHLQLALLDYEAGDFKSGEINAQTAINSLREPRAKAGLAEAYVIYGRIRYKLPPSMEGEAWQYVEVAREIDSRAPGPAPLVVPPFEKMRPPFAFDREIESRAKTCYATAPERDGYLATINAEVQRIKVHIGALDGYYEQLNGVLSRYNAQGYLEEYQGNVAGRGYPYRSIVLGEQRVIVAKRAAAATRLDALLTWHRIAGPAAVPCPAGGGARLQQPSYYQPRLPANDGYF